MTYKQDIQFFLKRFCKTSWAGFSLLLCFVLLNSCGVNKHLKENELLLKKTGIKYNGTAIDNDELEAFLRQKPNRKILKLVRFNLWLYNQVDQQKMLKKKEKRDARFDRINAKRIERNDEKNL